MFDIWESWRIWNEQLKNCRKSGYSWTNLIWYLDDFLIINAQFTFERRVGYYILQLYIPTAMLVLLSWGMLCLGQESSGDRITVGLTLFLTMIFLQGYANTSLPRVSYVKSIDLFMFVSLMEILLILIESIVVSNLYMRRNKKDEKRRLSEAMSQQSLNAKREQVGMFFCIFFLVYLVEFAANLYNLLKISLRNLHSSVNSQILARQVFRDAPNLWNISIRTS